MDEQEFEHEALALPDVEPATTWGHTTFRVGGRIFASVPDVGIGVVKATLPEQAALIARDRETFTPAPRVGRHGWVRIDLTRVSCTQVRALLASAWYRTAGQPRAARSSTTTMS